MENEKQMDENVEEEKKDTEEEKVEEKEQTEDGGGESSSSDIKIEEAETGEAVELTLSAELEEELKDLKFKELNLQTKLLLGIYRNFVPESKPIEPTPEVTVEEQEKADLIVELDVKRTQLRNNNARINGGKIRVGNAGIVDVQPIDLEIKQRKKEVRMREIELQYDQPLNAVYQYEKNDEYREILKDIKTKGKGGLEDRKKLLALIEEQKQTVLTETPLIQKRINEIEEKMELEKTNFLSAK